jgi:hypothetical protein
MDPDSPLQRAALKEFDRRRPIPVLRLNPGVLPERIPPALHQARQAVNS